LLFAIVEAKAMTTASKKKYRRKNTHIPHAYGHRQKADKEIDKIENEILIS
jgi:hypothetical protein